MTGPRLFDRDAELAVLAELIEHASERGSAIVVLGEAGIGKSTLLRAAVELARSAGLQVLQTAGVETEANLPFAGLHQLMIAVDDVQWLDRPTHEALTFVARRVSRDPIVIIGTVRKGHDGPFTTVGLRELDVLGLDDTSARDVLQAHGGDLSFADRGRILREALGNPLAPAKPGHG